MEECGMHAPRYNAATMPKRGGRAAASHGTPGALPWQLLSAVFAVRGSAAQSSIGVADASIVRVVRKCIVVCPDPENYRLAEADGAECVKLMPEWSKGYVRQATALFYQKARQTC